MHRSYGEQAVTAELLEELKRKAMLMEDELAIEGGRQFERTGRLNDPGLCEMSIEYENLRMDIEVMQAEDTVDKSQGKDEQMKNQ